MRGGNGLASSSGHLCDAPDAPAALEALCTVAHAQAATLLPPTLSWGGRRWIEKLLLVTTVLSTLWALWQVHQNISAVKQAIR